MMINMNSISIICIKIISSATAFLWSLVKFLLANLWTFGVVFGESSFIACQNLLFDLSGHELEGLGDVGIALGAHLEKIHAETLGHTAALVLGNLALTPAVGLVADEHLNDVLSGVSLDLAHPVFEGVEWVAVVDCVDHDDPHGTFVVCLRDGLEALLAGSVPDLQSDLLAVDFDCLDLKVDANCSQVRAHEVVLAKTK